MLPLYRCSLSFIETEEQLCNVGSVELYGLYYTEVKLETKSSRSSMKTPIDFVSHS